MTEISLSCTGASAHAEVTGRLTAGMTGVKVLISCDDSWNGLHKSLTAMTAAGKATMDFVESSAVLPWEVLRAGCRLYIGLEGRDAAGEIVMPTVWAFCGKVLPSAAGSHAGTPTPSEIEQILNYALSAEESARAALEKSDTALAQAGTAYAQAENFADWYAATERNARAAADALASMQYVSFTLREDGALLVRHPERLGATSFRLNYETGNMEVLL